MNDKIPTKYNIKNTNNEYIHFLFYKITSNVKLLEINKQNINKEIFNYSKTNQENNKELLDRISIESTPTLKFYCKNREIGQHIGYAIEPKLKQKIEMFLSEMEYCIKNSTVLEK